MNDLIKNLYPLLDENISLILSGLAPADKNSVTELRIRANAPLCVVKSGKCFFVTNASRLTDEPFDGHAITKEEVQNTFLGLCRHSVYAYEDQISQGYISLPGGHRAGVCGKSVMSDGITRLSEIYGICIRIASQRKGCARPLIGKLLSNSGIKSGVIISPPGGGKTTILRDAARCLSELGKRVCIVDERGEIAAMRNGAPELDVGFCTDVLDNIPKSIGITMAVRSLSPEIIIFDEISTPEEAAQVVTALNSGVAVLTSIHGENYADAVKRPQLSSLIRAGVLDFAAELSGNDNPGRIMKIINIKEIGYEKCIDDSFACGVYGGRLS